MQSITEILTPLVYLLLSIVWGTIVALYVFHLRKLQTQNKAILVLLTILAIDAFRTLLESMYFGSYFASFYNVLDSKLFILLSQAEWLIIPKLFNLVVSLLILFLLIKYWIPKLVSNDEVAHSTLLASEKRLRTSVKRSPNPVFIHAEDGEILYVSDKVYELTGYDTQALKTVKDWTERAYGILAESVQKKIRENYTTKGEIHFGEMIVTTKDGDKLVWDFRSVPLGTLEDGRQTRMTTATDITAEKKALRQLKFTQYSIDNVSQSILWINQSGQIISANQFSEKQLGYGQAELRNLPLSALQINWFTSWENFWQRVSEKNVLIITSLTDKHGSKIPVEISANFVEFYGEHFICALFNDISHRIEMDQTLLESELKRTFALEAAKIGDWDMDLRTNIAHRSLLHDQCFGYETPVLEWGYETFLSHIHESDRDRVDAAYKKAMFSDCNYDVEFRVIWPDGSIHWLWSKGRFFHDKLGNPVRVSGIQVDITDRKRQEADLHLNSAAIKASKDGIVIADAQQPDFPLVYVNPAFEALSGYAKKEVLGKNCRFLSEGIRDENKTSLIRKALKAGESLEIEILNRHKNGKEFWNQLHISPVKNAEGVVTHFVGIQHDVTARYDAEIERDKLFDAMQDQASLLDKAHDAIIVRDMAGKVTYWNKSAEQLYGWTAEEALSVNLHSLLAEDEASYLEASKKLLDKGEWRGDIRQKQKSGNEIIADAHWTLVHSKGDKPDVIFAINTDVTKQKKAEEEIKFIAFYDGLSGLPNRELLMQYLDGFVSTSAGLSTSFAIMILDLDNFKNLNDTYGHFMGDMLIKDVASRLEKHVRSNDFVARLGGDEFVVVMHEPAKNYEKLCSAALQVSNKIMEVIQAPFYVENYEYFSSTSIGITLIKENINVSEALKQADLAMYEAKRLGKNNIQFYDQRLQSILLNKSKVETYLRAAISKSEFSLHFQPQVDSAGYCHGSEALIRWYNDDLGHVSPAEFIPIAEESGLIVSIGDWVLDQACGVLDKWSKQKAFQSLSLAVNVSAVQFKQKGFVDKIKEKIEKYHFEPSRLKIELTESVLAEEPKLVVKTMTELKSIGLGFSLDDFGTGYSSLAYLKTLPIDQLKIDKTFVDDILTNEDDAAIADTIIKLSQSMKLNVIAEGVETEKQKFKLMSQGCYDFQGYYFSKPLPLDAFNQWILNHRDED